MNSNKKRESTCKWRKANAEKIKAYNLLYYQEHRDKAIAEAQKWRDLNPSKVKEYTKKYYAQNKDKICEYERNYKLEHPDKVSERYRKSREKHHEKRNEYNRKWYSAHKPQMREYYRENSGQRNEYAREWRKENPEKCRDMRHRRRARYYDNGAIEKINSFEIYNRDNWKCGICGKKVNSKLNHPNPMSASLDHIVPLVDGGSHISSNVQLAHLICNLQSGRNGIKQLRLL